ncbi:nuclear transport factor 2 family protein [Nocardia rhamnosiphila]|uniref:nuclear transport factor 2 family protein n=1 Tax=Nocardia rhamnosiphila TaxID=426716 RepID=UPI0033CC87FF
MISFSDHHAIERLIHLYPYYLDAGRFDMLGRLFEHGDLYIGAELVAHRDPSAVAALWRRYVRVYPNGTPRTRHVVSNVMIDSEGADHASAYSCVMVLQQPPGLTLRPIITGDYLDRFDKVDGQWWFTERRVGNDLFGDLSHHLLEPMPVVDETRPQRWEGA